MVMPLKAMPTVSRPATLLWRGHPGMGLVLVHRMKSQVRPRMPLHGWPSASNMSRGAAKQRNVSALAP